VQGAEDLIHSNTPAVGAAVTNLRSFPRSSTGGRRLGRLVATNRPGHDPVQNLRDTSASFKQVAADLEAGKGLVGGLLKDEDESQAASLISNANAVAAAFSHLWQQSQSKRHLAHVVEAETYRKK
jgi:hypothetical protein